jgi:hypothetical protein
MRAILVDAAAIHGWSCLLQSLSPAFLTLASASAL